MRYQKPARVKIELKTEKSQLNVALVNAESRLALLKAEMGKLRFALVKAETERNDIHVFIISESKLLLPHFLLIFSS